MKTKSQILALADALRVALAQADSAIISDENNCSRTDAGLADIHAEIKELIRRTHELAGGKARTYVTTDAKGRPIRVTIPEE